MVLEWGQCSFRRSEFECGFDNQCEKAPLRNSNSLIRCSQPGYLGVSFFDFSLVFSVLKSEILGSSDGGNVATEGVNSIAASTINVKRLPFQFIIHSFDYRNPVILGSALSFFCSGSALEDISIFFSYECDRLASNTLSYSAFCSDFLETAF